MAGLKPRRACMRHVECGAVPLTRRRQGEAPMEAKAKTKRREDWRVGAGFEEYLKELLNREQHGRPDAL